jgi:predicted site-specific integrase-resolvase
MQAARKKKSALEIPADGHLTVRQAAQLLGCVPSTVGTYGMQGRLKTVTVAGRSFVIAESAIALAAELEAERKSES